MTPLPPMMSEQDADAMKAVIAALPENARLIEFGCGGSTTMIASVLKPTQHLYSIEHNPGWYTKVKMALDNFPLVSMYLAPLDMPMDRWRFAQPEEEMGACAYDYIHPLKEGWENIDFAFVDGIARGPVLATLRTKLRPGTPVLVHDYTGRETWYKWATDLYDRVSQHDLMLVLRVPEK